MDEERLLEAILAGDHASRAIYADWLEQRGNHAGAEWIRLYEHEREPLSPETADRLRVLAASLDAGWRMQVARAVVEDCMELPCPRDWGSMTARIDDPLRSCARCDNVVHYCFDGDQACRVAGSDLLVFDAAADRRWTCPPCGRKNEWMYKFCLSCGMRRPGAR